MVFSHSGVPAGMPGFLMRIVSAMPLVNDGSTTIPSLMVPVPDRLAWVEFAPDSVCALLIWPVPEKFA